MTIDPETLMAYADGELGPIEAKRIERAIAADPALAERVQRHRALAASLRDVFAPIERAPLPASVETMLHGSAEVLPLASRRTRNERPFWIGAVAASLVAGFFATPLIMPRGDLVIENGRTLARGDIARALDTQLASTQAEDAAIRIGITFRDRNQRLCRSFQRGETAGIACASDKQWQIERLYGDTAAQGTDYRQAGSPTAELMAHAEAMMTGEPLDAADEAAAIAKRSR